jgi:hypothetical protein
MSSTTQIKGNVVLASDAGTNTELGNSTGTITMNSDEIIQKIRMFDDTIVQNVVGNTNQVSSYSMTFNHKNLATTTATQCYKLTTTALFLSQLLELTVSGCNASYGPYTYKCSFVVAVLAGIVGTSAITVLNNYAAGAGSVAITFTYVSGTSPYQLNIFVATPVATTDQNYVTTLVAYPTSERFGDIIDFAIEAT